MDESNQTAFLGRVSFLGSGGKASQSSTRKTNLNVEEFLQQFDDELGVGKVLSIELDERQLAHLGSAPNGVDDLNKDKEQ